MGTCDWAGVRTEERHDGVVRLSGDVPQKGLVFEAAARWRKDRIERGVMKMLGLCQRTIEIEKHARSLS